MKFALPPIPHRLAWASLVAFGALTLVLGALQGFTVRPTEPLFSAGVVALLLGIAVFYTVHRPDRGIATATAIAALFIANALAIGPLSYVVASFNRPLIDPLLADLDRMLGFDWLALQRVTAESWALSKGGGYVYGCSGLQMVLAWIVLGATGQRARLSVFLTALIVSTGVTVILSGVFPAVGAYVHYGMTDEQLGFLKGMGAGVWHLEHFNGLRDGSLRALVLSQSEGLVTFPSYHTVVAVLSGWSLLRTRRWAVPFALYSAVVLLTTLPIGGHHLVDILAGGAIALAAIRLATLLERHDQPASADAKGAVPDLATAR